MSLEYKTGRFGWRIENFENEERILSGFRDYLVVDRRLEKLTVDRHMLEMRRLFRTLSCHPLKATRLDIRNYLRMFVDRSPFTYANVLKTLRVFYRDYLGRKEVVEGFRFPPKPFNPKFVPSKDDIRRSYYWLEGDSLAQAILLFYATTGLRRKELTSLRVKDVDFERRMIIPRVGCSRTKVRWVTFYNEEAEEALKRLRWHRKLDRKLFPVSETYFRKRYNAFRRQTGTRITPQILREWFACEMGRLGVPDRYVDAFCGRVPRSILARHYTDFSPERLKEIYDKAGLKVLS